MSVQDSRDEIVTALSTVTGVKGFACRPTAPKVGDAWPRLDSINLVGGLAWRGVWQVFVTLPDNECKQAEWIDGHFSDIVTALRVPTFAVRAEPVVVETDEGNIPALLITTGSE